MFPNMSLELKPHSRCISAPSLAREKQMKYFALSISLCIWVLTAHAMADGPETIPVSKALSDALDSDESIWRYLTHSNSPSDQRIAGALQWSKRFPPDMLPKLMRARSELERERRIHNWGLKRHPHDARGRFRTRLSDDIPQNERKRTILGQTWHVPERRSDYPTDKNELPAPWPLQVQNALSKLFVWSIPHHEEEASLWLASAMRIPRSTDEEAIWFVKATSVCSHFFDAPHVAAWRQIALQPKFPEAARLVSLELPSAIRGWGTKKRYLGRAAFIDILQTSPHPEARVTIRGLLHDLRGHPTNKDYPFPLPATEVIIVSKMALSAASGSELGRLHHAFSVCRTLDAPPFPYEPRFDPKSTRTPHLLKRFRQWYEMHRKSLEEAAQHEEPFFRKARKSLDDQPKKLRSMARD